MSIKRILILTSILIVGLFFLAACAGPAGPVGPAGPAGPVGPAGPAGAAGISPAAADLTCTQCHNATTLIVSKVAQLEERSVHGTGEAFEEGERTACAGCHGDEAPKPVSTPGCSRMMPR